MRNEQEIRRSRLFGIVHQRFYSDNDWVARAIEERTGEVVSVRTIQAWLIQPNRKSSRNCPERFLKALEEYLQDPSNQEIIQWRKERFEDSIRNGKSPLEWCTEVRNSKAVDFATGELEEESRTLSKWQDEFSNRQGAMIFELQKKLERITWSHNETLSALSEALETSTTLEEFREKFRERERANFHIRYVVRQAKNAIENNTEEFATDTTDSSLSTIRGS